MAFNPRFWRELNQDTRLITLGSFLMFIAIGITSFILPFYLVSLDVGLSSVGFIFAFTPLIFGIFRFIFGTIGDMIDRKKLLWTSNAIQAGSLFAYPWVWGVPAFASLSMTRGLASSLRSGTTTPLLIVCNPPHQKGKVIALNMSLMMGGNAIGYVLGGYLLQLVGFMWSFIIGGFFTIGSLILFVNIKAICDIQRGKGPILQRLTLRGFNYNTKLMITAFFLSGMAVAFGEAFALPLTLESEFFLPMELIGIVLAIGWICQSTPGFTSPSYNDNFNPKWLSGMVSIICGVLFFMIYVTFNVWMFVGIFLLYNLLVALVLNNRWVITGDAARSSSLGKDMAIPSLGFGVGSFIGSNIAGIIAENFGYRMVYGLESFFWIIHGLVVVILVKGYPSLAQIKLKK